MSGEHTEQTNGEPSTKDNKRQYLHGQIGFWVYGDKEISPEVGQKVVEFMIQVVEAIKEEEDFDDVGSEWVLAESPEKTAEVLQAMNEEEERKTDD